MSDVLICGMAPEIAVKRARELVAVADAATDQSVRECIEIVERFYIVPTARAHGQKKLSLESQRFNKRLDFIVAKLGELITDPVPF